MALPRVAVPLALAEALWARSTASPLALLPIVQGQGFVRWTQPQSAEALAPALGGLPKDAALVTGVLSRLPNATLEVQLTLIWPKKKLQKALAAKSDTLAGLADEAERVVLAACVSEGLVSLQTEAKGLLPTGEQRTQSYLSARSTRSWTQLLAGQELINRAEVFNGAFVRANLGELVRALPGVSSPLLMFSAALLACARLRPDDVAAFADDLRAMSRPPALQPLEGLLAAADGGTAKDAAWSAEDKAWAAKLKPVFGR